MLSFGNKEFRNLQEQVLKNAQDIETLKGRENLQIVIVEELPEEGNPNYIYLVPNEDAEESNIYNEYIWLADEETYEKIGGVDIDLTNYVTLNTTQTVTGDKTFEKLYFSQGEDTVWSIRKDGSNQLGIYAANDKVFNIQGGAFVSMTAGGADLGSSSRKWKNVYVSGIIDFGDGATIKKDSSNRFAMASGGTDVLKLGAAAGYTYLNSNFVPEDNNLYDLGRSSYAWKNVYVAGNISDGVNSVSVANIASKVTSSYASGTFDANGEDTIDISGGTPEGLFIFNCGNCQAMLHLTATMVQNAELTPIRVPAIYINNSNPAAGWLNISKSGNTLTLYLGGGLTHIDSGYAWTLTKTSLM